MAEVLRDAIYFVGIDLMNKDKSDHSKAQYDQNALRIIDKLTLEEKVDRMGINNSAIEGQVKLLKGFERVSLEPGETKNVTISCPIDKLRWYKPDSSSWKLELMTYRAYIGCSSRKSDLVHGSFKLP